MRDGPERGGLPRPDRGCQVTPAGVMEWCAGATIITAREGTSVDALSRSVARPAGAALPLCQGAGSLCLRRKIRRAGVVESVREPILAGTPVRESSILDAHVSGRPVWL